MGRGPGAQLQVSGISDQVVPEVVHSPGDYADRQKETLARPNEHQKISTEDPRHINGLISFAMET